jgi:hypothetical protein
VITPPPPGSFGLSRIGGLTGALVAAGQAVLWDGSRYTHAFVVVVQAMPSGAELAPLADYVARSGPGGDVVFTDTPVQLEVQRFASWVNDEGWPRRREVCVDPEAFERNLRQAISAHARELVGTPYSFADYLALAAVRLGLPSRALRRYVAASGRMICSQLVDAVYCRSDVHLFTDGRPSMDVTPGDLDAYRVEHLERLAASR